MSNPNQGDWNKPTKALGFLRGTKDDILTFEADDEQQLTLHVDSAFAVHSEMKSQTGATFTLGKGSINSSSTKQKVNARSSTEAELIGIDYKLSMIILTKWFTEAQGHKVTLNVVYQDNTNTIKLAQNGKTSSGKRTHHFDIKCFYITDLIGRNEIMVEYCPTEDMVADYMTKPLTGTKFHKLRTIIMNYKD